MDNQKKYHWDSDHYDQTILKNVPYYLEMLEALSCSIPYSPEKAFLLLDLGCGTGNLSGLVKQKFPHARITCLDSASNMIEEARKKLCHHQDINYRVEDFRSSDFSDHFDVILSSLALHHLPTDADKQSMFKKIFAVLNRGGAFFNADLVLASDDGLQQKYLENKLAFMKKGLTDDEICNGWMPRYKSEDRPARLIDQLIWLSDIGFKGVDVIWKYYHYAVYGGYK